MDMEKAHDEMCRTIGAAVIQVISESGEVSRKSIADMMGLLAGDEPDLAVDSALDILR